MAHEEKKDFYNFIKHKFPEYFESSFVLDIGSFGINGNNHNLFEHGSVYLGVDVTDNKNMDITFLDHKLALPNEIFDLILLTGDLNNNKYWQRTLRHITRLLKPNGLFLMVYAATDCSKQATQDVISKEIRFSQCQADNKNHHHSITEDDFRSVIDISKTFNSFEFSTNKSTDELYFWGIKNATINYQNNCSNSSFDYSINRVIDSEKDKAYQYKQQISNLTLSLKRVANSRSYRYTYPCRLVYKPIRLVIIKFYKKLFILKYLLVRSYRALRYQGVAVFVKRAIGYAKGHFYRKFAFLRVRANSLRKTIQRNSTNDKILVSFVIPVYDRTDVLRIAIESVLSQTISNIELIIVTDGSPAETINVVNQYRNNPKVKIFHYPINSGVAIRGRNKAIIEARGRYIAFLDSDDIAVPERVELCLPLLESGKVDVVYGAWQAIVDGSRIEQVSDIANGQIVYSPDANLDMLLKVCVPCQSTVMVRKTLLEKAGYLKPSMRYREDHELWARLAYFGGVFRSVPHVLAKLRLHSGNNELNFKKEDEKWFNKLQAEYKLLGPKPKKIVFVLPSLGISGGGAVVIKHAALLMEAGHDVCIVNVGDPSTDAVWFPNNPVPTIHIFDPRLYNLQHIDLLFATEWSTVKWLAEIPSKRKLYFVQSDERRFYQDVALKQQVHNTYLTECEYVTEALWIKKMLKNEFGHDVFYVPNGLDTNVFYSDKPLEPKKSGKIRVLLEGPIVIPFKGMADSYAVVAGLDCEVWIVSSAGRPPADWHYDRFFEAVPFGEMRNIYSSCDIFLKMSRVEGFFGPPMEAMACGCSVVVGKVTGYDEFITDEINALVVEQGDVKAARKAVQKLIRDNKLREHLIQNGYATVSNWTWERSQDAMLAVINATGTEKSQNKDEQNKCEGKKSHSCSELV